MQSESINVLVALTNENAHEPTFGSEFAAGADLYACIDPDTVVEIAPGQTIKLSVGIKTEVPDGYVGLVFARSGLSTKEDLAPANKVGVIDSDYRGEWFVPLHNHGSEIRTIANGERIAQVIFIPVPKVVFETVTLDQLTETERGEGGFGSTGTN
jgi:dUTP pyrophosphatase